MTRLAYHASIVTLVGAVGLVPILAQSLRPATSITGPVPLGTDVEFGEARFKLSTRPDNRVAAELIDASPRSFGTDSILRDIGRWQVNSPLDGATVAVKFALRPNGHCDRDNNRHVEVRWPTITILGSDFFMRCVASTGIRGEYATSSPVNGFVVDESGTTLPGVDVQIQARRSTVTNRHLKTDGEGRFVANGLPNGEYVVLFDAENGLIGREYLLTVTDAATDRPWRVVLAREKWPTPEPPAVVRAADLPEYPVDAWAAGVSGTIDVRVSFVEAPQAKGEFNVTDIDTTQGDGRLVRAVRRNIGTWRFRNVTVPVLVIRYTFRLMPGDCTAPQFPTISMRFPASVEIVAKRQVPCVGIPVLSRN